VAFTPASIGKGLVLVEAECPAAVGDSNCAWAEIQTSDSTYHSIGDIGYCMEDIVAHDLDRVLQCLPYNIQYDLTLIDVWHNATQGIHDVFFQLSVSVASGLKVTGVRYGYQEWPVATLYNKNGLPATPFYATSL
jgi:hypothetical protein